MQVNAKKDVLLYITHLTGCVYNVLTNAIIVLQLRDVHPVHKDYY